MTDKDNEHNAMPTRLKTWTDDDVKKVEVHINLTPEIVAVVDNHAKKKAVLEFFAGIKTWASWVLVIGAAWTLGHEWFISLIQSAVK